MTEARDALAVALEDALRRNLLVHTATWAKKPMVGSDCADVPWDALIRDVTDAILAALPDGWVLARREDAEDGAALRELREALGDDTLMRLENLLPDTPRDDAADLWLVDIELDAPGEFTVLLTDATGPTIAAAARKAKDAL